MKNILLTGQLIWEALQAESGDFDVLWEVLQSQKVQGYITQIELDTLYHRIAQEQDVGIAFGLINQLRRVLLIHSSNGSQPIDIEVNNSVYPHSVAIELAEAPVLSLHGFLERYALQMLYTNDTLTDGSDPEVGIGMQQWYRKWRQSGFDMLWLIPVFLTLALQSMPFFQKVVADLFEQLEGGQTPGSPEIAQKNRRSEPSPAQSPGERSPLIPFPRLPNQNSSQAEPSNSTDELLNIPDLRGDSLRYPFRNLEPSATEKTATPPEFNLQPSPVPQSSQPLPTRAIDGLIEVKPALPALPPTTPQKPSNSPSPAPDRNEPYNPQPVDDSLVPTPVFSPPLTPIELDPGVPIETPLETVPPPTIDLSPIANPSPTPPPPPADFQLDVAGDGEGVMIIPDPLIDPSSIADPSMPNQPVLNQPVLNQPVLNQSVLNQSAPNQFPLPDQHQDQTQSNLPDILYNLTLTSEIKISQSGKISVISLDNSLIEMVPGRLGTDSSPN